MRARRERAAHLNGASSIGQLTTLKWVLANGEVVKASEMENADLFHGAAGAVGSLGVVTLVELHLIEAKKYVKTIYHPVASIDEAIQKIEEATADPELDYVDGILFSKTQGAIITGRMMNNIKDNVAVQRFSRPKGPWFFLHVKDTITKRNISPTTEMIPLDDYLFRYDRGGFWVGVSAFKYWPFPFNRLTRWFLDNFLRTRMLYRALHARGRSTQYMVQDLALPMPQPSNSSTTSPKNSASGHCGSVHCVRVHYRLSIRIWPRPKQMRRL